MRGGLGFLVFAIEKVQIPVITLLQLNYCPLLSPFRFILSTSFCIPFHPSLYQQTLLDLLLDKPDSTSSPASQTSLSYRYLTSLLSSSYSQVGEVEVFNSCSSSLQHTGPISLCTRPCSKLNLQSTCSRALNWNHSFICLIASCIRRFSLNL